MKTLITRAHLAHWLLFSALFVACIPTPSSVGPEGSGGSVGGSSGGSGGSIINVVDALSIHLPPPAAAGAGGSSTLQTGGAMVASDAGNCGSLTSQAERVPADVLLVQDASGSMTWSISEDCICDPALSLISLCSDSLLGGTCSDRWSALKSAVTASLSANGSINWGLELFATPGGQDECAVVAAPQVPISANSGPAIQQVLASVTPDSSTPTAAAIKVATAYLGTVRDSNKKAILLATDGEPNCGESGRSSGGIDDLANTLSAIQAANAAGFPVYVVGIGPSTGNLASMAQAGGTTNYYPATSPQQLSDALAQISKIVASCTFTSPTPPPDPALVSVYVDKKLVTKDPVNGWDFGASNATIVLHGTQCNAIMAGTSTQVQIVFGCPGVPPVQIIP